MRLGRPKIVQIVNTILSEKGHLRAGELAREAGITRQAAHRHLAALVREGRLQRLGQGRGARYRRAGETLLRLKYPLQGLAEDRVWQDASTRAAQLRDLPENVARIAQYALTELVNNAVDHSNGTQVEVVFHDHPSRLVFEVIDDGEGIFEHLRRLLGLPDRLSALQEVTKGKVTTWPERHTGEGLFFVSRSADFFEIDSGGLCWKVDNVRQDFAVGQSPERPGTHVRFEVDRATSRELKALFDAYTEDYEFSKTRITIRLFAIGTVFISRSEARRMLAGLERFRELTLDFDRVSEIGQGFADEVFRVWAGAHPDVRLLPVNMNRAVEFMVERARRRRE